MPLKKAGTKAARTANIKAELQAGRTPKQAVAIAYNVQRRAQRRRRKARS